jgi:hypothetical protein
MVCMSDNQYSGTSCLVMHGLDRYAGQRRPVMINGKGIETDSDVVVVEPGDTQEEEDVEI